MNHKYWMNEYVAFKMNHERISDRPEEAPESLQNYPVLGFYLVSFVLVFVLIRI